MAIPGSDSYRVVTGPTTLASPGNPLKMQSLGPHPRPSGSETLGVRPSHKCFKSPSSNSDADPEPIHLSPDHTHSLTCTCSLIKCNQPPGQLRSPVLLQGLAKAKVVSSLSSLSPTSNHRGEKTPKLSPPFSFP